MTGLRNEKTIDRNNVFNFFVIEFVIQLITRVGKNFLIIELNFDH